MRAFGKEAAACDRYAEAVLKTQSWGLKSASLGGAFGAFNTTFTTGMHLLPLPCTYKNAAHHFSIAARILFHIITVMWHVLRL